jgi:hypothetical protein
MAIISSIHVYNFHLIISYLGKGIRIIKFEDFRNKFRPIKVEYPHEIETVSSLSEITTFGHQLFGIQDSKVKSLSLSQPSLITETNEFDKINTNQISLDYDNRDLYLLSEDEGIIELDIRKPLQPSKIKSIFPKSYEKREDFAVANMVSYNREILLAYRGFGASQIRNYSEQSSNEFIYRTEDAQDVRHLFKNNVILVADGIEGLVVFKTDKKKAIKKVKLYDSDFPQELTIFNNNILIKGKSGLYFYDLSRGILQKIWEGSVGAFTTYYDYIFFSSNGKINLLCENQNTISQFELIDKDLIDIKVNKYLR